MPFNEQQPSFQHLRSIYSESRKEFAFWVGAGLSEPAGLPMWAQLRDKLTVQAWDTLSTMSDPAVEAQETQLNHVLKHGNNWEVFERIEKILGTPTYRASIRGIFGVSDQIEPPTLYREMWSLDGVRSVLSLNIDQFAARSHRRIRPLEDIASFCGRDAGDYMHLLRNRSPFIANLHGVHERASTWVFTKSDLTRLFRNQSYKNFITGVLSSFCIVFVGVSADDVAAGGFLHHLTSLGLDMGQHFWITGRRDSETQKWANQAGLQVIRYDPHNSKANKQDHTTPIKEIFDNLRSYVSKDKLASPVIAPVPAINLLPPVNELKLQKEDDLRASLAGYARGLLDKNGGDTSSPEYAEFLRVYSPCVHQSWHLTANEPYNIFYGLKVVSRISTRPFSNVWKVSDSSGAYFALKIIQIDNLSNGPQLESFRRGVQSLGYLTNAKVPGTANIRSAFEIPTSVIMDFVEGDNLFSVVTSPGYEFWRDGIVLMISVCKHLQFSHNLPQGVLHRDVRPSNIMAPYYYWETSAAEASGINRYEVTLLNYDMSWHAQARGTTIAGNMEEAGFYAPEQLENSQGEQARRAQVDSYGVGMTIFYAATGTIPPAGGSRSVDWIETLRTKLRSGYGKSWRSAPEHLRRLILQTTLPTAIDRPLIPQILAQLTGLKAAIDGSHSSLPATMWAEEILMRVVEAEYQIEGSIFQRELRLGRTIKAYGRLQDNSVVVEFSNLSIGSDNRSNAAKSWRTKLNTAKEIMVSGGWEIADETRYGNLSIWLIASASVTQVTHSVDKLVEALKRGLERIRID